MGKIKDFLYRANPYSRPVKQDKETQSEVLSKNKQLRQEYVAEFYRGI